MVNFRAYTVTHTLHGSVHNLSEVNPIFKPELTSILKDLFRTKHR